MVESPAIGVPKVRRMIAADVDTVATIEGATFSSPWKADTFLHLLDGSGPELWVLDLEGDGGVGYAVLWCILDEAELANIAVDARFRGRGWGRLLLEALLERARERGVKTVYLEVRVSNEGAMRLYLDFGFEKVGVRRDYYTRPREDAVMMARRM